MMDAGRTEKAQIGRQICRELMEKLDIKSYETVTEGLWVTGNFMWRLQAAGTFCCGCRKERSMNGRKRRLIECGKPTTLAFQYAGPLLSEAVMTGDTADYPYDTCAGIGTLAKKVFQ